MKTDQAGQVAFETMCKDLGQIQDEQNTGNASGSAAAVRNANAVVRVAQIGAKRSKNIAQGGSACTVKDFMKHLQNKFPGPADGDDDTPCLDWQKNAKVAAQYFTTTPTVQCLANPLGRNFEPKPRKIAEKRQRREAEEVRPLDSSEGTTNDSKNTEKRKQQLSKVIQKWKVGEQVRLAKLITHPQSFGETCENLFACSFLVERNDLALTMGPGGCYMAQKVVHRKGEETHETENLVREILKMDWDTYEGILKELFPSGSANAKPYFTFDPSLAEEAT